MDEQNTSNSVEVPALPAPMPELSEEAATLLTQFRAIDPKQQGAGLNTIAIFYPKVGWNIIRGYVSELEDHGLLSSRTVLNRKGSVSHKLYTWKAV